MTPSHPSPRVGASGHAGAVHYGLDGRDGHLLAWLRRELPSAVFVGLRTGFFTTAGLAGVEPDLEELVERGGRLEVLIGGNPLQYEVSALRALLGLSEDYPGRIEAFVVMAPDFLNTKTSRTSPSSSLGQSSASPSPR